MTLSAKRLGERCGLTAEEMNILLKEEGFLSGEPGNYYPTEKGKLFVVEKGDDNGYGGYAFRGWNWFEWDERILEELDTSVENKRYIREKTSEERRRRRAEKAAESEAYWKKVNSRKEQPAEDISNELKDTHGIASFLATGMMHLSEGEIMSMIHQAGNSFLKQAGIPEDRIPNP